MGGKQSAEWWREYRRRKAEVLRAYNRERRQSPKLKAQRKASEARRRQRLRSLACKDDDRILPFCGCELYKIARQIVGQRPASGSVLTWSNELLWEDAIEEVVLALIEDRDPVFAVKEFRSKERMWKKVTCQQFEGFEGSIVVNRTLDW